METGGFKEEHVHCVQQCTILMRELYPLLGLTGRKKVLWIVLMPKCGGNQAVLGFVRALILVLSRLTRRTKRYQSGLGGLPSSLEGTHFMYLQGTTISLCLRQSRYGDYTGRRIDSLVNLLPSLHTATGASCCTIMGQNSLGSRRSGLVRWGTCIKA